MKNTTRLAKKNYKRVGKGGKGSKWVEMGRNFTRGEKKKRKEWESDRTK